VEAPATAREGTRSLFVTILAYWMPVLLYITLIVVLSAQPNLVPPFQFRNADKLIHVGEYFVLGVLLARASHASFRAQDLLVPALFALAIGVAVGAGDEVFQSFIPGRDSSPLDWLADSFGVALAQFAYLTFGRS
jgi:VanZ family protein